MRIFCPQCQTIYEVKDDLIPEEGRKLKCSNCKEIFRFDRNGNSESITQAPQEQPIQNEFSSNIKEDITTNNSEDNLSSSDDNTPSQITEEDISIKDIFERLNEQSEHLFQEEQKLPIKQRYLFELKTMLGLNRKINFKIISVVFIIFMLLCAYNYRYEIVRTIPVTNIFYKIFAIKAQIPGEGLEFQNVNWNYIDNNENRILEVKGFINNPTQHTIDLPTVHVELLDKNSMLLQSINQKPTIKSLKSDERIAIGIVIKTPSPTAKYVYMTFIETN